jgi:hypothetical protein
MRQANGILAGRSPPAPRPETKHPKNRPYAASPSALHKSNRPRFSLQPFVTATSPDYPLPAPVSLTISARFAGGSAI